jgi:hypothetical protein
MGQHGKHGALVTARLAAAALALLAGSAAGAVAQCRLALLIAMDVSASVDAREYVLQRDGLARALDAPDIRDAILNDPSGHVALAVYEWSGRTQQTVMLDWTVIDGPARLDAVIAGILGARRGWKDFPTAIGYALGYGAGMLAEAPDCDRQVIDISGDGTNNEGFLPASAYRHFPFQGVTVNGLVIEGQEADVLRFYQTEVLRGPGAFLEVAQGFEEFEAAMARKLFREINGLILGSREVEAWQPG